MHSRFGSSRIHFYLHCAGFGNATLQHDLSVDDLSLDEAAAAEGNVAHKASEHCLILGMNPVDCVGMEFNGQKLDEVMAENITVYTNHVRTLRTQNPGAYNLVEPKLFMTSVAPDVWGFADHMQIAGTTLYIDDLKYGFVIVNEEDNPQCAHLAVSALDTYNLWFKITKIVCTIIQPRAEHVQGSIRSVEYTIEELQKWRDRFATAIFASRKKDAKRTAGKHCRYCPVRATCRARMIRTVFMSSLDSPIETVSDEEVENLLRELPAIRKHLEAIENFATILARSGKKFRDFKLVKQKVHAICDDEEVLINLVVDKGLKKDVLYHPGKMKGKTALRPVLAKVKLDVNDYFTVPQANTKLVPLSNTSTAVNRSAAGVFKPIKD